MMFRRLVKNLPLLLAPVFLGQAQPLVWVDPATKLTWTAADNGSGLSWSQAFRYCRELELGGYKDWTLPAIGDLQGIFQRTPDSNGYHVSGPLRLTGWQWSSSPGSQRGEGWALDFGDGARASVPAGDSGLNRALCIRRPSAARRPGPS